MNLRNFGRLLSGAILLITPAFNMAAEETAAPEPNCFIIVDTDGVETEFFGAVIRVKTDDATKVRTMVAAAETEDYSFNATWPLDKIAEIRSEYREMSGIATPIAAEEPVIGYDGAAISVKGSKEGSTLRVFDAAGRMVASHAIGTEATTYSPAGLSSGVYIVEINGKTLKIAKK